MTLASFRKWVFWAHLITGLVAGLFVFIMSFTGVLLTYERQLKELAEMSYAVEPREQTPLTTDQVVDILQARHPQELHIYVRWVNREGAAIPAWAGRHSYLLHPYSGDVLRQGEGATAGFFHVVTDLHRYLLLTGDNRVIGKTINGYANLVFLFLLITGFYLWFPKRFNWRAIKQNSWLPKRYINRGQRNRQWHFTFGIWSLPALFIIAATATLFHFEWANKALYGAFGQSLPEPEQHAEVMSLAGDRVAYERLFIEAKRHAHENGYHDWYSMWMEIGEHEYEARFYIDKSIGRRQELAYSLYFDTRSGAVTEVQRKSDWSEGGQAWGTARFLHTGEYFGFIGQTIAGAVSLLACILVYTGVLLAWRRLVRKPQGTPSLPRQAE